MKQKTNPTVSYLHYIANKQKTNSTVSYLHYIANKDRVINNKTKVLSHQQ